LFPFHLTFATSLIANPQPVEIKHAGKQHKVEFNPVGDAKAFKESIYQVTGVPTGKSFQIPTGSAFFQPGLRAEIRMRICVWHVW
jgi:hypothetical protein